MEIFENRKENTFSLEKMTIDDVVTIHYCLECTWAVIKDYRPAEAKELEKMIEIVEKVLEYE